MQDNNSTNTALKKYLSEKPIYLIQTGLFQSKDSAAAFAKTLTDKINLNVYIQRYDLDGNTFNNASLKNAKADSITEYIIKIGKFNSSYQAGKTAYKLRSQGIIKNYEITRNNKIAFNNFADLFFIGKTGRLNGIFRANIFSRKTIKVWVKPNENVAHLDYLPQENEAFFLTVSEVGYNGIFPFVRKAKLYLMSESGGKIKLIKNFGDCIQLYSHWEAPNFYRVTALAFDKNNPMHVIENELVFNEAGVIINDENKSIDLARENYPKISEVKNTRVSPNGKYTLLDSLSRNNVELFIKDSENKRVKLILTSKIELNKVMWTEDSKYLVFSTLDLSSLNNGAKISGKSKLYIYSTKDDKIISLGSDDGLKDFLIRGDLVIFDDGFNTNSKINVYNISENKLISSISVRGGCGINRLP